MAKGTQLNNELKRNLLPNNNPPPAIVKPASDSSSWLSLLGFAFLAFNSGMAVYRSRDDIWSVLFVVSSFLDLLLLFYCLKKFERTPRDSPTRGHLKIAVWSLSTFLTLMFSYRVAALMPLAVAIIVWIMSLGTIGTGFYLFFIYKEEVPEKVSSEQKPALKMVEGP
ncbi:hypothetical protein LUZ63_013573 [Rhynchospora breviuscula]|uniref:Uncharacterized protein n=1 Tax=Rhynchospora breviuscula TaxID=2022672 RepID=A0A9Q0C8W3_9POAL|nr:hypothetical protein LUZ63_013573 [Rhynchospora breviuscula]